jgi:hypothetical protein
MTNYYVQVNLLECKRKLKLNHKKDYRVSALMLHQG